MNTNDLGMFLLLMAVGSASFILFVIAGGFIRNILKTPLPARITKTAQGARLSLRRKASMNPNIICMLPIHEEKRTEERLW